MVIVGKYNRSPVDMYDFLDFSFMNQYNQVSILYETKKKKIGNWKPRKEL